MLTPSPDLPLTPTLTDVCGVAQPSNSKARRAKKRQAAAALRKERGPLGVGYRVRPSTSHRLSTPQQQGTQLLMERLPAASHSWVGKNLRPERKGVWTLRELLDRGFELRQWNGRRVLMKMLPHSGTYPCQGSSRPPGCRAPRYGCSCRPAA